MPCICHWFYKTNKNEGRFTEVCVLTSPTEIREKVFVWNFAGKRESCVKTNNSWVELLSLHKSSGSSDVNILKYFFHTK